MKSSNTELSGEGRGILATADLVRFNSLFGGVGSMLLLPRSSRSQDKAFPRCAPSKVRVLTKHG